jgi:hypothetical protein
MLNRYIDGGLKAVGIEITAFSSVRQRILPGLSRIDKPGCREMATIATRRRVGGSRRPLLEIALLAAVEAVLAGLDFFFALRRYSNPVLYRGVPVQVAVLDHFAHFEKPRVIGRSWLCLVCRAHAAL